jgi:serine/threonine-protein kinase
MGEVLKAKDTRLQRTVAIKVLPTHLSNDAERRSRFEREARSASALNHPNITTVFDIGEDDGTHYIVLELVEGKTLRELLKDGPLATDKMIPFATQIAEGLAKAHTAGIVHRDLKPENLMVTEDGLVKILDFGLAKLMPQTSDAESDVPTETRATQQGAVLGTVPYMSPEQAASRPLDYRSDQFSLGSILYEMATGKRAFQKATVPQTLAAIIEADPEPIQKLNEGVPVELSIIIERCLNKDPGERYESTGDLARELKAVPETPSAWSVRRGTARAGIGVAVLPLRNLSGDPEQEYFADGMTEALITNLAKVSALKVIARHSAMRYKASDRALPEIARELGVEALVEGSALRAGNSVRIMAQLIDPKTEQTLWAESYERDLENVLVLQGEVARAIAVEVQGTLTPEEAKELAKARPVNAEAHDAHLKGSYHWKKLTPEDLDTAQRYFDLALEKDPDYAPAYEGLAWVWACRQQMGITSPQEAGPRAKAAALRALELDEGSAGAHEALALVRTWTDWDWPGAEEEWRRALELDPKVANTHAYFAHFLAITGRIDEAITHSEQAIQLDPYNALFHGLYAVVLNFARRYSESTAAARAALAIQPGEPVAQVALLLSLYLGGLRDEQLALQREWMARDSELLAAFERGLGEAGFEGAQRGIANLLATRWLETGEILGPAVFGPADLVDVYVYAGEHEKAMDWIDKAYEVRDPSTPYIGLPLNDPLRVYPRFQDQLRRMNLPKGEVDS